MPHHPVETPRHEGGVSTHVAGATFLPPSSASRPQTTGFGLPPDLLQKSRRRVELVGWLLLLGGGASLAVSAVAAVFHLDGDAATSRVPLFADVLTAAMSLVVIAAARSIHVRNATLLDLALVFEVLLCACISIGSPLGFYTATGAVPILTWVTPLIILFPLIVPCPPARTLISASLAAVTAPLGLWALERFGQLHAAPDAYFAASFGPLLAVVMAYFGSRVVYGLGRDVAEARRMGSYHLERLLGRGGMGEVWLARHRLLARPAAVKLVRSELLGGAAGQDNDVILQRFEREAQATAAMRSPHTINLYDYGVAADGTFYYVMELLDGCNADALVKQFGPLPSERAVYLLRQICHSLAEAHERGLIHRDIKPANVFVCRYGRDLDFVKVLDFGLAKTVTDTDPQGLTAQNVVFGTPAFMAPEQALGPRSDDARSDIYAVGCLAYWLVTGRLVFERDSAISMLMAHVGTEPTPPSQRTESVIPAALDRLILSCLSKDPAARPQSASALDGMLAACTPDQAWTNHRAVDWWTTHLPATVG